MASRRRRWTGKVLVALPAVLVLACSTAESTPVPAEATATPTEASATSPEPTGTPEPSEAPPDSALTPSPLPPLPTIELPEPTLDPRFPEFPLPAGAELLAARTDGEYVDSYRSATWLSPEDVRTTTAFYEALSDGRWTPTDAAVVTTLGATLEFADAEGVFDRAAVTIGDDPAGARIAVRFLPPAGPEPIDVTDPDDVITYATLPPVEDPDFSGLPEWALLTDAELVAATVVDGVSYAELFVPADPAAVLDAYGRALDEAGVEREVTSSQDAIVIGLPGTEPPGAVALARDPEGTRVYLTLP